MVTPLYESFTVNESYVISDDDDTTPFYMNTLALLPDILTSKH